MGEIIEINQKRTFTISEARDLLPIVKRITRSYYESVSQLSVQMGYASSSERKAQLKEEIRVLLEEWQSKMLKLGAEVKGMWLVDFDSGEGYYCWHYPEPDIEYFHGYIEGFGGRVRLQ